MGGINPSSALAAVVVDELVRGGVTDVVLAPGSRSTALAVAVGARDDVGLHVRHDERSAAFVALGMARVAGRPAAVVTTSGTAVSNLGPAVAEAHVAGVPLVLLTADRPAELHGVGANQTFGQAELYRSLVRWHVDLPAPSDHPGEVRLWRSEVARAVAASRGRGGMVPPGALERAGPVHLNLAFREPTVPGLDDGRSRTLPYLQQRAGRPDGAPWTAPPAAPVVAPSTIDDLGRAIEGRRVLVVAGDVGVPMAGLSTLRDLGFPVVAEPTSGPSLGSGTPHASLVLAGAGLRPHLRPDLVLRLGHPTLSRGAIVGLAEVVTIQVGEGEVVDPTRTVSQVVSARPAEVVQALATRGVAPPPADFTRAWSRASGAAADIVADHLDRPGAPEPAVARRVAEVIGERTFVVASSLPIRDVMDHASTVSAGRVVANRGLAGIDGFTSTAVGVAIGGGPTVALAGDLSFLHDHNGLLVDDPSAVPLTMVVVDNDGGGIFHQVPAARVDVFERCFGTPHGRDLVAVAEAAGVTAVAVAVDEVGDEVARPTDGFRVVVVRTDRHRGVRARRAIVDELGRAR